MDKQNEYTDLNAQVASKYIKIVSQAQCELTC